MADFAQRKLANSSTRSRTRVHLENVAFYRTIFGDTDLTNATGLETCWLLLILSQNSMSSEWVKTEIAKARRREVKEKRRMSFPVRLVKFQTLQDWQSFDADTGKDSPREIREYFIPDFSRWKDHDSYRKAFDHLLRDLKADEAKI